MTLVEKPSTQLGPVLVTGGAGYIGGQTVLCLLDAGAPVVVIDNLSTGNKRPFHDKTAFYTGDVGDQALVEQVLKTHNIKSVLHFAGSIRVDESIADPLKYYQNNTEASRRLISAAIVAGVVRIVFSSTAAVYGNIKTNEPVHESASTEPLNPYGWSKLFTEKTLGSVCAAHGIQTGILRYFNVAGADARLRHGQYQANPVHLIGRAINAAIGRAGTLEIYGNNLATPDGTGVRDYIHVQDLAEVHVAALKHMIEQQDNLLLNLGYGTGHSVIDVIKSIERVAGKEVPHQYVKAREGEAASVIADASLLNQTLGWTPKFNELDVIVRSAYDWQQNLGLRPFNAACE